MHKGGVLNKNCFQSVISSIDTVNILIEQTSLNAIREIGMLLNEPRVRCKLFCEGVCLLLSCCLPPAFTLVSCSASPTLKMEAIFSFETSVDFH